MMRLEKNTNFLTSFFIYILAAIAILTAGFKVIEHSGRLKFYNGFLLKWEQNLTLLSSKDTTLPAFSGSNHIQYMDQLVSHMKASGIPVLKSNTTSPFIYRITTPGTRRSRDIFLLGFEHKIVLFNLSKTTFNMLDKKIDQKVDMKNGIFKGKQQKHSDFFTGIWTL